MADQEYTWVHTNRSKSHSVLVALPYTEVLRVFTKAAKTAFTPGYVEAEVRAVTNYKASRGAIRMPGGGPETEPRTINLANVVLIQRADVD